MEYTSKEKLSTDINTVLDNLGYSENRITERRLCALKTSWAKDKSLKHILKSNESSVMLTGSQREGIGFTTLNDTDILQINESVICVENFNDVADKESIVFKLDYTNTSAGYTQLLLINKGKEESFAKIKYALVCRNGKQYLSSDKFMSRNDDISLKSQGFLGRNTCYHPRKGPSIPKYVKKTYLEQLYDYMRTGCNQPESKTDLVRALPCKAKSILKSWSQTHEADKWPFQKGTDKILTLPMYVVPVGHTTSRNRGNEWRISFTMSELHLIQSFNNTQVKLLVLLKLIAKHILQPISQDMTSYVMKHVTFWIVSKQAEDKFQTDHLLKQVENAIVFLKSSIQRDNLPHFLINERNLFEKKLPRTQKRKLLKTLTYLVDNGHSTVIDFLSGKHTIGKSFAVKQVYETIALANVLDKTENCKNVLFMHDELTEFMEDCFHSSHLNLMLKSITNCFIPYYINFGYKDVMSQNLVSFHFQKLFKKFHEYNERNTYVHATTETIQNPDDNLSKENKDQILQILHAKFGEKYVSVWVKNEVKSFKQDQFANFLFFIVFIYLIIDMCLSFYLGDPKVLIVLNVIACIILLITYFGQIKSGEGICKHCGKSKRERLIYTVYTRKGIYRMTLMSKRLYKWYRTFIIFLFLFLVAFLSYEIGQLSHGLMLPTIYKVVCTMSENCYFNSSKTLK